MRLVALSDKFGTIPPRHLWKQIEPNGSLHEDMGQWLVNWIRSNEPTDDLHFILVPEYVEPKTPRAHWLSGNEMQFVTVPCIRSEGEPPPPTGIQTINHTQSFYGYIIGLQIARTPAEKSENPDRSLYATFEYAGVTKTWKVPDLELFTLLSQHLEAMAYVRVATGGYGVEKLSIAHNGKAWIVELP